MLVVTATAATVWHDSLLALGSLTLGSKDEYWIGWAIESGGGRFSSRESELHLSTRTKCTTVCMRWRRRNEQRHGDEVKRRGDAEEVDTPRVHDGVGV